MVNDDLPCYEVDFELPELLKGPITLPNGDVVDVGDKIEHPDFGLGTVIRLATYHDHLGLLLCVEFSNGNDEMLGLNFVKKVTA